MISFLIIMGIALIVGQFLAWFMVYGRFGAKFNWRVFAGPWIYQKWVKRSGWCNIGNMYETDGKRCDYHIALDHLFATQEQMAADALQAMAKFDEAFRAPESP